MLRFLTIVLLGLGISPGSQAEIRMEGDFTAEQACPAVVSIRKKTNPDNSKLTPDRVYAITAANMEPATHYQVRVPGARPRKRWVKASCGYLGKKPKSEAPVVAGKGPEYVLALTWQPAFCEMRRSKSECRSQTADRFDADNFTLHGLWPQPRNRVYCGVSNRRQRQSWSEIPSLRLSGSTMSELRRVMPGTKSYLQRHEWLKHGTCYGKPAEAYFVDSMALLKQVNSSAVRNLFAGSIGSRLTAAEVRAAVDKSFGRGTGAKTTMNCKQGMITELQFNIRGNIDEKTPLSKLLAGAVDAQVRCAAGRVDRVGY